MKEMIEPAATARLIVSTAGLQQLNRLIDQPGAEPHPDRQTVEHAHLHTWLHIDPGQITQTHDFTGGVVLQFVFCLLPATLTAGCVKVHGTAQRLLQIATANHAVGQHAGTAEGRIDTGQKTAGFVANGTEQRQAKAAVLLYRYRFRQLGFQWVVAETGRRNQRCSIAAEVAGLNQHGLDERRRHPLASQYIV